MRVFGALWTVLVLASAPLAADSAGTPFDKVKMDAAKNGVPILLVFTADWSEPSKSFSKAVLRSPDFKRFVRERFMVFNVDFSRGRKDAETRNLNKELSDKYHIRGIPSLVVADSSGKMVASFPGTPRMDADACIAWLKKILDRLNK